MSIKRSIKQQLFKLCGGTSINKKLIWQRCNISFQPKAIYQVLLVNQYSLQFLITQGVLKKKQKTQAKMRNAAKKIKSAPKNLNVVFSRRVPLLLFWLLLFFSFFSTSSLHLLLLSL